MNAPAPAERLDTIDMLNILDTMAFIARVEQFGLTYAKVCQAQVDCKRAGVCPEAAPALTAGRNYWLRVNVWDRKVKR